MLKLSLFSDDTPCPTGALLRAPISVAVTLAILAVALLTAAPASAQRIKDMHESDLRAMQPTSPNPYVSLLPAGVEPDFAYWNARMKFDALKKAAQRSVSAALDMDETEPNDTPETATFVDDFGFGAGQSTEVDVSGSVGPAGTAFATAAEDNGSIPLATAVSISDGLPVFTSSILGNGPHGSSGSGSGDFDFFEIAGLQVGDVITADVTTPFNGIFDLDSYLTVFDSAGTIVAQNDDKDFPFNLDSFVSYTVTTAGTYYICVGSWNSQAPSDPFVSGTGPGVSTEGDYDLVIGLNTSTVDDPDYFSFDLNGGDVLGVNGLNTSELALYNPAGELMIASAQDASGIYPASSPLPGGSGIGLTFVAPTAGRYVLLIDAPTGVVYTGALRLFRPALEAGAAGSKQILFVDFDGATVNTSIFGGPDTNVVLSPLSAFLSGWGLQALHESVVIDAIMAAVEENLRSDMLAGNNPHFDIELRNSRDHADPFGQPNVSRLIVGGTIDQFGLATIGIAESIDPGNFNTTETAVILLDLLSAPASNPNSLNQFSLAGGKTIFDLIGAGVGNITAHEAGHYFGNFHTDQFITPPNIMDQGGNLPNTVGVGTDTVFGNGDDVDVDFGEDEFVVNEGFAGTEDTLNVVAFGLSTPNTGLTDTYVSFSSPVNGNGTLANPFDNLTDAIAGVEDNGTVHIFPGSTPETFSGVNALDRAITLVNENPGGGAALIGAP